MLLFPKLSADITNPQLDPTVLSGGFQGFLDRIVPNLIGFGFVVGTIIFLFMILVGGAQFMASGGDAQAKEKARGRITNAVVGLLLLFTVYFTLAIINTVFGISLGNFMFLDYAINLGLPSTSNFANLSVVDTQGFISASIEIILIIVVIAFLFMFLYGGIVYMTSAGEPAKLETARRVIRNAFIGLIIAFSVFVIGFFINAIFGTSIGGIGTGPTPPPIATSTPVPMSTPIPTNTPIPTSMPTPFIFRISQTAYTCEGACANFARTFESCGTDPATAQNNMYWNYISGSCVQQTGCSSVGGGPGIVCNGYATIWTYCRCGDLIVP